MNIKEIEKVLEFKIDALKFEWFTTKNNIHPMDRFNEVLSDYMPHDIVDMTQHKEFYTSDDYFYFREEYEIVSLRREEVYERMEEEITEDNIEELDKFIIKRILGA